MTTIATDGRSVAADTLICTGSETLEMWPVRKIYEQGGLVFACAGDIYLAEPFIDWYLKGRNRKFPPSFTLGRDQVWILVFDGGRLWEFGTSCLYPVQVGVPIAIGTGRQYAMGALALRHSPEEAVLAATRCDPFSGGRVDHLVLPKHLQIEPNPAVIQLWDQKPKSKRALGGYARMALLTPEERSEFARKGGITRQKLRKGKQNANHRDES